MNIKIKRTLRALVKPFYGYHPDHPDQFSKNHSSNILSARLRFINVAIAHSRPFHVITLRRLFNRPLIAGIRFLRRLATSGLSFNKRGQVRCALRRCIQPRCLFSSRLAYNLTEDAFEDSLVTPLLFFNQHRWTPEINKL